MSVQAMAWALEQQIVIEPTARHVLLVLANYAGKTGRSAYPSVGTLARETGLSERTVQSKLKHLLAIGIISFGNQEIAAVDLDGRPRHHGYRVNVYDLNLSMNARGEGAAPLRGEADNAKGVNLTDASGVNLTQSRGEGAAPNPRAKASKSFEALSKSLSENPQAEGALPRTLEVEDLQWPEHFGLEQETVEDFWRHCRDLGKPLTASAWKHTCQELQELWDNGADLNQSLVRTMQTGRVIPVDPTRGKDAVIEKRQQAQQRQVDQSVRWAERMQPPSSPDREGAWNAH